MIWSHVSTEVEYRNPLGALRTGEAVRLSLAAVSTEPKKEAYEVRMKLLTPDGTWKEYELIRTAKGEGSTESSDSEETGCAGNSEHTPSFPAAKTKEGAVCWWSCEWTAPEQSGVYWYYFSIRKGEEELFYGANAGRQSGQGSLWQEIPPCYQLTVYEKNFVTPEWFQNATMYQIFPDRYCRGRKENLEKGLRYHLFRCRKMYVHQSWEEVPFYRAMPGERDYYPSDFFGGDLEGIRQNLDMLQEMGITCLYLNPIVESDSNHRYNTADYKKVDPILGTMEDFIQLCREAEQKGIRILLDGVFSHTGSDSIYFNREKNYLEPGAYQEEESPYDSWYSFGKSRRDYKSWWGFDTLPEVNELDASWQEYIIKGKESVFRHWLDKGAYGFRLDVADELPDEVIEEMRLATKQKDADKVLLGEVWEDATTKESYGTKRTYALGKGLDSVMNYPFRDYTLAWLNGHCQTEDLADFLNAQRANYPEPMYLALMNLLSSHDVARLRTVLGAGSELKGMSRIAQAEYRLDYVAERRGARLSRLAMLLQFILPGVPSVYYGDEYGMCGLSDPFNRGPFEKRDPALAEYVKEISLLRRREKCLRLGRMSARSYGSSLLAVLRLYPPSLGKEEAFLAVFNRSPEPRQIVIRLWEFTEGFTEEERTWLWEHSRILPKDVVAVAGTGKKRTKACIDADRESGTECGWQLSLTLGAYEGEVLHIH